MAHHPTEDPLLRVGSWGGGRQGRADRASVHGADLAVGGEGGCVLAGPRCPRGGLSQVRHVDEHHPHREQSSEGQCQVDRCLEGKEVPCRPDPGWVEDRGGPYVRLVEVEGPGVGFRCGREEGCWWWVRGNRDDGGVRPLLEWAEGQGLLGQVRGR